MLLKVEVHTDGYHCSMVDVDFVNLVVVVNWLLYRPTEESKRKDTESCPISKAVPLYNECFNNDVKPNEYNEPLCLPVAMC